MYSRAILATLLLLVLRPSSVIAHGPLHDQLPSAVKRASATASGIPFSPGFDIAQVASLAKSLPSHSWEYGTASESLLELYNPELSVFGSAPFPVPTKSPSSVTALSYGASHITLGARGLAYSTDGAVGDPVSLGVTAVLLSKTNATYAKYTAKSIAYLLTGAPRFWNHAISQRADVAELW